MTDDRADEDRLVWLEAVDDEDGPAGLPARKMLAAVLVVLVAVALIAGTLFWLGRREGPAPGGPEMIQAEPGPFKVRPENPGGLDIAGDSETAFATSAGEDRDAQLDLDAVPEAPLARPVQKTPEQPAATVDASPSAAARPSEPPAPTGSKGNVIQLGAYANQAQAEAGWKALSSRFPAVAAMTKLIVPYSGGYRLRAIAASPEEAAQTCRLVRVAGDNCFVAP